MKVLLLILVCLGAFVVIAAGIWVALALAAAVLRPAPQTPQSQEPDID